MRLVRSLGIAVVVAAVGAGNGHATTFNPDDTAVHGVASNPTLSYGGVAYVCPNGTMSGTTGIDSASLRVGLSFGPVGQCTWAGSGAAITCTGTMELRALDATNDSGTANLDPGFDCTITIPFTCSIHVRGPQDPPDSASLMTLNEGTDVLSLDSTFQATRTGAALCGPPSGSFRIVANYSMSPSNLTIDP
jgi:hypothetical protein